MESKTINRVLNASAHKLSSNHLIKEVMAKSILKQLIKKYPVEYARMMCRTKEASNSLILRLIKTRCTTVRYVTKGLKRRQIF